MPGPARIALLTTAILLAVALGACGAGDSAAKNDYVRQVNAAQTRFASAVTEVKRAITSTSSPRQDRRALVRFGATIDKLIATLRAIKVPGDVRSEHGRFVAAMVDHREAVGRATVGMRSSDAGALAEAERQLTASTITVNARLSSATRAINAKLHGK